MKLVLFLLLFLPFSSFSQECWKCLSNARGNDPEKAIATCSAVIEGSNSAQQKTVAGFLLARQYMDQRNFTEAYAVLNTLKSGHPELQALILGLKGDCCVELGQDEKAIAAYSLAVKATDHDWITPWFLFKAGKLLQENGRTQEAYTCFKTVTNTYQSFAMQHQVNSYIDPKTDSLYHFNAPRTALVIPESGMGIGMVNGKPLSFQVYNSMASQLLDMDRSSYRAQQREYTEADMKNTMDRAWDAAVTKQLIGEEMAALDLPVSSEEITAYLLGLDGFQPLPEISQSFVDEEGRYSIDLARQFISDRKYSEDKLIRDMWQTTENLLGEELLKNNYIFLLQKGLFITSREARAHYHAQSDQLTAEVVHQSYTSVGENQVPVTEKEIREYYNVHQAENIYDTEAGRDLQAFSIPIVSTASDSAAFLQELQLLKKEFARTKNDSLFVMEHSEAAFYNSTSLATFRPQSDQNARQGMTYPDRMQPIFDKARKGDVIGPYEDQGTYRIAKVIGFNKQLITARHILIASYKGNDPQVHERKRKFAESLLKEITEENFEQYVRDYSEDPGSNATGGVYADWMDYEMVQPFADYGVNAPIGKIGIVETDFGFHIMEVIERKKVNYPILVLVEKTLVPTPERIAAIKDAAQLLLKELKDRVALQTDDVDRINTFNTFASAMGYFPNPTRTFESFPRIASTHTPAAAGEMLRTLYHPSAAVGQLCAEPIIDGYRIIICMVSSIHNSDSVQYATARGTMKAQLIKEKQGIYLVKNAAGLTDLAAIANTSGTTVETVTLHLDNPMIPEFGYEPLLIRTLFMLPEPGTVLLFRKGYSGLYSFRILTFEPATEKETYAGEQLELQTLVIDQTNHGLINCLQHQAGVLDNRSLYELGIRK